MEKNLTALMCLFVKAYHYKNNKYKVLNDNISMKLLSDKEYEEISNSLSSGITFFNPGFIGTKDESLDWIVNKKIGSSILGRSIFCEKALDNAIKLGAREYLIYASGYDTYAYRTRYKNLKIYEIDKEEVLIDKKDRLTKANIDYSNVEYLKCDFTKKDFINNILNSTYDINKISFNSLLGISYYLTKEEFFNMIKEISNIISPGSSIVFDYPVTNNATISSLAQGANSIMKSTYNYKELEEILSKNNLYIYEHLNSKKMLDTYFDNYNILNPNNKIIVQDDVSYILSVKR